MEIVAITGARGYLGAKLAETLTRRGMQVRRLVHSGRPADGNDVFPMALDKPLADDFFRAHGVTAVVHCAYDFRPTAWHDIERVNVRGTAELARAAARGGVKKQIFVSSLSAYPGCVSNYGRAKLDTESQLAELGVTVVRPGLLYDAAPRGLVGTIKRLAGRLPVIPLIGSGAQIQYTCHVDDLCVCIAALLSESSLDVSLNPIIAANETPLAFKEIVRHLATLAGRPSVHLLPIPWRLVWLGLKTLEIFGLSVGLRSDSVLGLQFALAGPPDFSSTRRLDCEFREFRL